MFAAATEQWPYFLVRWNPFYSLEIALADCLVAGDGAYSLYRVEGEKGYGDLTP